MKNKKVLVLFIISVILIVGIGYFAIKFVKQKKSNEIQNDEYIPQYSTLFPHLSWNF